MKKIITNLFTKVALVACLATAFAGAAKAQSTITIDFEDNALPNGWTNTNEMAVVSNPVSSSSSTNGAYCLSTNAKASNSLTSGLIENIVSISVDAVRTSSNTTNEVYIDFCPNNSFGSSDTQSQSVTVNKNSWSTSTLTLSSKASGYVRIRRSGGKSTATKFIDNIVITLGASSSNPTCETPTFYPTAGTYKSTQSVTISSETEDATIYYTTDGSNPTTSSSIYSTAISVSSSTTIKAIAAKSGYDNSSVASASYNIISLAHEGNSADPYTVADSRTAIDANTFVTGVFATGIVSQIVTAYDSGYGNITFDFVDEAGDANTLRAYRCTGTQTADASAVQVGDIVVVSGDLTKYNSTYEFAQGCTLVSLTHPAAAVEAPTFSPAAGTYSDVQNVTISTTTAGAAIYYTTDGTAPTSSSTLYSGSVAVNNYTTIKAIAINGSDESSVSLASYHICSLGNPYTVTQALDFKEYPANGIYVNGIVSTAPTQAPTGSGQLTYSISLDGTTTNELLVYKGKGMSEVDFTAQNDIQVGDVVTIYGNVKDYQGTIEFDSNNYLVAFNRPVSATPSIDVDPATVNATAAETPGTITVTYNNITTVSAEIAFYTSAAASETTNPPAWLDAEINNSNNVEYLIAENATTDARTAYLKVWAYDDELNEVYSDLITINQDAPVVDYATLPFAYDGNGLGTLPSGLTQSGLTDKYNSSPKMKFDGTGEYVILHFNERPGILTFDIKGNGFSGGTFDVQTSEDGTTYSNLTTYTELGTTQSESINNLGENVRYIKWIYTTKSSGNVALGNIALAAYVAPSLHTVSWTAGANTELFVFAGDQSSTINSGDEVAAGTTVYVSVDVDSGYVFESLTVKDANNDDVSLTTIDPNIYYSFTMPESNVTITSSAIAAPPATGDQYELFTGTLVEGDYVIYYNGVAMKNTVDSGRLYYEIVTPVNDVITTDDASIVWHIAQSGSYWTIYSANANAYAASTGAKSKAQLLAAGDDDKAQWTISGSSTYNFVNKANSNANVNAYLRNNVSGGTNYGFACYAEGTGGALSLYKLVEAAPATIDLTATSGGNGFWVSFYNGAGRYDLPDGAQAFTMNNSHQLYRLGDGDVIPQGVAVIIIADKANITLTKSNETGDISASGGDNILQGSDSPVTKESGKLYYVLGLNSGAIDFYKYTGTSIPAGKAYFTVNE